jgi:glyoxylase-like metal-dependent hydrolase (beta-lactamase superfamily II)
MSARIAAPGVYVVETSTADGKIGVITGRDSALAVDAGINRFEGQELAGTISDAGFEPDRMVYTHGHVDHVLGSLAFGGAVIIGTTGIEQHMRAQVDVFASRESLTGAQLARQLGFPTQLVSDDGVTEIDVGGRPVNLMPTPGHAPGALSIYIPDARVLFGGDTIVTGIPPTFKDGNSSTLERTLRRLSKMRIETLIPGHGPIVYGESAIREAILWSADYIARCRDLVVARPEADLAALMLNAPYTEFIGDHLPPDRFQMLWRHEQTVVSLLSERDRGTIQG